MIYDLKYSPNARDKLRALKKQIMCRHGKTVAMRVISNIVNGINSLKVYPEAGQAIEKVLDVPVLYRFLHIEQSYIFYRIDKTTVYITEIFNEREDIMSKMFGVSVRTQESVDYWGE